MPFLLRSAVQLVRYVRPIYRFIGSFLFRGLVTETAIPGAYGTY